MNRKTIAIIMVMGIAGVSAVVSLLAALLFSSGDPADASAEAMLRSEQIIRLVALLGPLLLVGSVIASILVYREVRLSEYLLMAISATASIWITLITAGALGVGALVLLLANVVIGRRLFPGEPTGSEL